MESLMDVYKVTKWKDGCVFKTKLIGHVWMKDTDTRSWSEIAKAEGGDTLSPDSKNRWR